MKLFKMFEAFLALQDVYSLMLPYKKSREIMQLKETIRREAEFYTQQEKKLAEQFAVKENGQLKLDNDKILFPSRDSMQKFSQKREELKSMEIDMNITAIQITEQEIENQCISAQCIENLKGFIEFGGD